MNPIWCCLLFLLEQIYIPNVHQLYLLPKIEGDEVGMVGWKEEGRGGMGGRS